MLDWTQLGKDPNGHEPARRVSAFLKQISRGYEGDRPKLVCEACRGKRVLDIGAGEHSTDYFNEAWEHAIYKKFASQIVAVEIDAELCAFYNEKGFDFRCVDATSPVDLGERFDFIYCGDVIEHVENAVALVKFISRHLTPGATCMVVTPNPMNARFRNVAKANGDFFFISNLEHVSWVGPTHMLEILRRSGEPLELEAVLIPQFAYRAAARLGGTIEEYFEEFVFVLRK